MPAARFLSFLLLTGLLPAAPLPLTVAPATGAAPARLSTPTPGTWSLAPGGPYSLPLSLNSYLDAYLSGPMPAGVEEVAVTASTVTIRGSTGGQSGSLQLAEIPCERAADDPQRFEFLHPVEADAAGRFSIRLPRSRDRGGKPHDRLLSKWQLARQLDDSLEPVSHARWTDTVDTPKITPRNLEVLDAFMRQKWMPYQGATLRPIHLSENGFNSPDYSEKSLRDQAAGMAYAWKKIIKLPSIQSWQYHNWIDNHHEGGLRIGLRKFPDDPEDPLGPKPIWHLYQALATPREDAACAPYLPVIGIKNWAQVIQPVR